MENAIEVRGLCKRYPDFQLQDVSFNVPAGSIVGFIGENGAGKTTTMRAILGTLRPDGGEVTVLGKPAGHTKTLAQVGAVFEDAFFYEVLSPAEVGSCLASLQPGFDKEYYRQLLAEFELPPAKKMKDFSRGMRMKLRLAAALAHRPKLLLLDEATSGLDPVMRAEILDLLRRFIQDEEHSVLLSSHITADLEKAADYIVYIQKGRILFEKETDLLLEEYGVLRAGAQQIAALPAELVVATRANAFGQAALVKDRRAAAALLPDAVLDKPTLDDIMQFYSERRSV